MENIFGEEISTEQKKTVKIYRKQEAVSKLYEGLSLAADVVASTMGPSGKNVVIRNSDGSLIVTRDGVTVCNSIKFEDKLLDTGAELLKKAAQKTNEIAGDGTTTSTVLTKAIVFEGLKLIAAGHNPNHVRDGINKIVEYLVDQLDKISIKIKDKNDLKKVANISANNDSEIAEIVSEAVFKSGLEGVINVEEGKSVRTTLEFLDGLQFDSGYMSAHFVNDSIRNIVSFENAYILITEEKISALKQIIPILEEIHKNKGSLLIIAEDIEGDALQGLILNRIKSGLNVAAVKSPYYGKRRSEFLKDLSILTGATLHSECSNGPLEKNKINICGKVKRVLVTSKFSTITSANFNSENIEERKNILRSELSDPTLSHSESVFLKERLAKLSNGVATIKVGGITEVEAKERMYRIEDAVNATRTAFEAGVLPGGGIALLSLSNKLEKNLFDEIYHPTVEAIKKACEAPLRQIVSNTGLIPDLVIEKYKEKIYSSKDDKLIGYDARNFCFDNMFESGIIDPLNVTKAALSNATSVANIFISLDSVLL
jgi:chaperonin GroEL